MSRRDVPDELVVKAVAQYHADQSVWPYELLAQWTGQPEKVCFCALERASDRGLIDYGVSLRTGWLTKKGEQLLKQAQA